MATKAKIAHPKPRTKRAAAKPVDAADKTGINPATGFAPDEQAALDQRRKAGIPVSEYGSELVKQLRAQGFATEGVRATLRHEAHNLEDLAERLTPAPVTRDAMLKDALKVIEVATAIFEHEGEDDLLAEALRSAGDDIELFECAKGSADAMAFIRAERRVDLALKLAAFQRKHPTWKPAAENDGTEGEQAAGGAS